MAALMTEFADTVPTHVQRLVGIAADRSRFDTVVMGWETCAPALLLGDAIPMLRGPGYAPLPLARALSRAFASGMVLDEYVRA